MADKTVTIANFKFGVDARREDLASNPGTLVRCVNGHINPGGEVEKRKAFVTSPVSFPADTFGLQDTDTGLMCFGNVASPSGALPAGVVYQRLQCPTGSDMVLIRSSCNFKGKAFVIAEFEDGTVCGFYNGTIIAAINNGQILPTLEGVSVLSSQLYSQIQDLPGWQTFFDQDIDGNPLPGSVIAESPSGLTFATSFSFMSDEGAMGFNEGVAMDGPGTPGVSAVAAFLVNGGVGTVTISAPLHEDGTGTAVLVNALVTVASSATDADLIVAAINSVTALYGYYAATDGSSNVFVSAPLAWGASANGFFLTVNVTGAFTVTFASGPINPLKASVYPNPDDVTRISPGGFTTVQSDLITATAKGGTAPYTYLWRECDEFGVIPPTTPSGIIIGNTTSAATRFSKSLPTNTGVIGYFKCRVTDAIPNNVDSEIVIIQLSHETNN